MKKVLTKRRFKLILPFFALLIVVAPANLIVKNLSAPAQGSVSSANSAPIQPHQPTGAKKYNGKYISFTYPADYKIIPSPLSGDFLEVVTLNNTDHSGKYISIGVLRESLANDSGYNHRLAHPKIYKKISGSTGDAVFTSTQNGAEQTGFIIHGDLVVSISITSIGNTDLTTDYETVANSLHWLQ